MNIYAKKGDKVIFAHPSNGWERDIEEGKEHLEVGKEYTIDHTVVHGWHTEVYLQEVPDISFNSVMFEDAGGDPE